MTQPLLETRAVSKHFGALRATNDVTFCLEEGARHALIGPNGAGKTTFINLLDRKSTRLNSSHIPLSRMPSSA